MSAVEDLSISTYEYYIENDSTKNLYFLKKDCVEIGRLNGDLTFPENKKMSSSHCKFIIDGSKVSIVDTGAKNATKINDMPLEKNIPRELSKGDVIKIGDEFYKFGVRLKEEKIKINSSKNPEQSVKAVQQPRSAIKIHHKATEDLDAYEVASLIPRLFASSIDGFILGIMLNMGLGAFTIIFTKISPLLGIGIFTNIIITIVSTFIIYFATFYFIIIKPLLKNGQTIGRKLLKLKLVSTNKHKELNVFKIICREFLKMIYSTLFFITLPYYLMTKKTGYDKIFETKVVKLNS